jgi:TonB family protein
LKPSNVLVVGEQVKLASDTIGPASDVANNGSASAVTLSPYQPPEASSGTAAGDVWSLGVMTCEALSRRRPAGLHAVAGSIVLPPDIPSTFGEMISKCLSRKPEDRPDVARLQAWQKGGELGKAPSPASMRLVIRAEIMPPDEITAPVELEARWRPGRLIIAAAVLLAIVAVGIYFLVPGETPPEANGPVAASRVAAEVPRAEPAPAAAPSPSPAMEAPPPAPAARTTAGDSAINEVTPVVPRSASQTIRGTIRVSVRVIVDKDGNVMAATAEDPGPSRYFERLSLEAAKKWVFAPAETGDKRLMLVKFNYTRSGTTAKASPTE